MDIVKQVLTIVASILPFFIGFLTFLVKSLKDGKAKKILNQALKITEAVQPFIVEAEKFTHYSGDEKKQYVLTKLNQFALDNHLKFDADEASLLIEEVINTTKQVNAKKKETEQVPIVETSGSEVLFGKPDFT